MISELKEILNNNSSCHFDQGEKSNFNNLKDFSLENSFEMTNRKK